VPPLPNKFMVQNEYIEVQGQMKLGYENLLEKAKLLVSEAIGKL
jgi:hypothetical protein